MTTSCYHHHHNFLCFYFTKYVGALHVTTSRNGEKKMLGLLNDVC